MTVVTTNAQSIPETLAGGYAGFWVRFAATLIDAVIIAVIAGIASAVLAPLAPVVGLLSAWIYRAAMESGPKQATVGKMALGLKVTDLSGQRISFGRATGRYFGHILSSLILCIGHIMVAFTERKQAMHDMLAGTLVVRA